MQFVWMHIVADKVDIYGQTRASEQGQCASAYQNQTGCGRNALSQCLQYELNFCVVHN